MSNLPTSSPKTLTKDEPVWAFTVPMSELFYDMVYHKCQEQRRKAAVKFLKLFADQVLENKARKDKKSVRKNSKENGQQGKAGVPT